MRTSTHKTALITLIAATAVVIATVPFTPARSASNTMQEACMNQWLFNGVWRVRITKVEPFMDGGQQVGWQVTESWRNGTTVETAPGNSLLKDEVLELADGSSIDALTSSAGTMSMSVIGSHTLSRAAQFTYVQVFRPATLNPTVKPKAMTIVFDGDRLAQFTSQPHFTTHKYNYRVKLDCQGSVAQSAQGGSFEIPAKQGCMNQWMSNGLWRVRATAIAPYGDPGAPQIGWKMTEEWTSLARQTIVAYDTNIGIQQLVLGNGDTLLSDAGVIASGAFVQFSQHSFAPGSSFTYQQPFLQIPFDSVDKPVKLIVTFDSATEKKMANRPQYKVDPPNFRINLECTK